MGLRRRSGFVFACEFRSHHFVVQKVMVLVLQLLGQLIVAFYRLHKLVPTAGLSALAATVTVLQLSLFHLNSWLHHHRHRWS